MNIFPRKPKSTPDAYCFGEYNEEPLAPFSISVASFNADFVAEQKHYHTKNQKVYLTLEGEGVLNIDAKEVRLEPNTLVQVEPNEVHFVQSVIKAPLKIVVITSSKVDDKVMINESSRS